MSVDNVTRALQRLLDVWPTQWPGLPFVFESCLLRLGGVPTGHLMTPRMAALQGAGRQLAGQAENMGRQMAQQDSEPRYHNRLHTGLALVSLTALLAARIERGNGKATTVSEIEYRLLLTMLSHDMGHPGGRNVFLEEIEKKSVALVQPVLMSNGVSEGDREWICWAILQTDPRHVASAHAQAIQRPFQIEDDGWQCVLVQEADVLASALPGIGDFLTTCLADEWAFSGVALANHLLSRAGRDAFLRNGALFSSPASHQIGMPAFIAAQLAESP